MKILQIVCIERVCGDTCVCALIESQGSFWKSVLSFYIYGGSWGNAGGEACVASILRSSESVHITGASTGRALSQEEIRRAPTMSTGDEYDRLQRNPSIQKPK